MSRATPPRTTRDVVEDLTLLVRTRHPVVTIETADEAFALDALRRVARTLGLPLLAWNVADGLTSLDPPARKPIDRTSAVVGALNHLRSERFVGLTVLLGAGRFLQDAIAARLLRQVAEEASGRMATVVLVDPEGFELPSELAPVTVPCELGLPGVEELRALVAESVEGLRKIRPVQVEVTDAEAARFVDHLRGLTRHEARRLISRCLLDDDRLTRDDLDKVVREKRERLQETGVVEFIATGESAPVGGMENLSRWLEVRKSALTPEARAFGLDAPKGILLLGVQGCGKSLAARATAELWSLPLLRLDVGALYNKFVGETERQLRQALSVATAMAPCVLWIDEIEKAFGASGGNDGGVSSRMFGALLTWLQDHREPVFVVGTANDISSLPPELMRKGRFDEIFFVDLPDAEARAQIASIHLRRRKRDPAAFDLATIAAACEGFSGAEIEQAVVSGLYRAFADKRALATQDVVDEAKRTKPLGVVAAERINALRAWAATRCVPAD
jgi:ATPase family associated with various cellular activities (AAA)